MENINRKNCSAACYRKVVWGSHATQTPYVQGPWYRVYLLLRIGNEQPYFTTIQLLNNDIKFINKLRVFSLFLFFLDEQYNKYLMEPDQPLNSKILRLAIIGIPNSGKSTLINQLMNWKVSIFLLLNSFPNILLKILDSTLIIFPFLIWKNLFRRHWWSNSYCCEK